jgi:hypothetical protein
MSTIYESYPLYTCSSSACSSSALFDNPTSIYFLCMYVCVCMYAGFAMHVCMQVLHAYVCICIRMYVYVYVYVYVYMYMYVCMQVWLLLIYVS